MRSQVFILLILLSFVLGTRELIERHKALKLNDVGENNENYKKPSNDQELLPEEIVNILKQHWNENDVFQKCDTCQYLVEGVILGVDAGVVVGGGNVWAFVEFWCNNLCSENCTQVSVWEIMLCKGAGALLLSSMAAAITDGSINAPYMADTLCSDIHFCEAEEDTSKEENSTVPSVRPTKNSLQKKPFEGPVKN